MRKTWVLSPHSGGSPIPPAVQEETRRRILAYAKKHYSGKYTRIDVRFRGRFCYIDAFVEPYVPRNYRRRKKGEETRGQRIERMRKFPTHLCRLRYFAGFNKWSLAFYSYSHETYEPSFFDTGDDFGTPEEGFETGAVYLR